MAYKIAVATSDGKIIDTHFGHASSFSIFTVNDDGSFEEDENRDAVQACSGGCSDAPKKGSGSYQSEDNALLAAAENLSDVEYVLAAKIGPGAVRALATKGITAFDIVMPVEEAVKKINVYREKLKAGALRGCNPR